MDGAIRVTKRKIWSNVRHTEFNSVVRCFVMCARECSFVFCCCCFFLKKIKLNERNVSTQSTICMWLDAVKLVSIYYR